MCSKALDIAIVLKEIQTLIPEENEKEHRLIKGLIEDVFYRAPEMCNYYWNTIYDHLSRKFNNGLDWEEEICQVYNIGYKNYVNKYKN